MTTLGEYQEAMARVLLADDPASACPPELAELLAQPGFAVYRNTVIKGCIDALQANYPATARLVGEEWFRAAAAIHVRSNPPRQATLAHYGEGFADFLAQFPPAAELPYLPGVARVERMWTQAHVAADAPVAQAASIAELSAHALARLVLAPHPSARWAWFDTMPVRTIWQRNRAGADAAPAAAPAAAPDDGPRSDDGAPRHDELSWQGEGVLLARRDGQVLGHALDAGGCAFLDACARGESLAQAAQAALLAQPGIDLARLMACLLEAGAFAEPAVGESAPHATNAFQESR